ncbi:MAG: glycosyl transferase family 2 [Nitrospiraceae bacterium]
MTDEPVPNEPREQTVTKPAVTAEIVVGVLTLNNAGTIEHVVKGVLEGLRQFFSGASVMIVNCDAGSQDGTVGMIERLAAGQVPLRLIPAAAGSFSSMGTDPGLSGREEDVRRLCETAQHVQAKVCLIVEGNLRSFTPRWIELLGRPIYQDEMDYVVPLFRRHRYEGTLVTNLLYPLMRALYGKRLRYPSGGGYGLSGRLARELTKKPFWSQDATRISLDGWLTTVALAEEYQVCHAFLGAKDQDLKLGSTDLANVLAPAVGSIFHSMEDYETAWEQAHAPVDVPLYGIVEYAPLTGPVHIGRMVSGVRQGIRDLLPLWEVILSPETLGSILAIGIQESDEFHFPSELWVQVVYEFALAYHDQVLHREHILKSLTPLYLGRTASFVLDTQHGDTEQVEAAVESLCLRFEAMKPYLRDRWRWRDE